MRTVISNPAYHLIWFPVIWLEVIFHTQGFGELYLLKDNRKALVVGTLLPLGVFANPSLKEFSPFAHYFFLLFVVRLLFELARLSISKLRGKAPHNYSMSGPSRLWLFVFPNLKMVSRFIEPLISTVIGVAFVAMEIDVLLGCMLCWTGFGFCHKFHCLDQGHNRLTKSTRDFKIEAQDMGQDHKSA